MLSDDKKAANIRTHIQDTHTIRTYLLEVDKHNYILMAFCIFVHVAGTSVLCFLKVLLKYSIQKNFLSGTIL